MRKESELTDTIIAYGMTGNSYVIAERSIFVYRQSFRSEEKKTLVRKTYDILESPIPIDAAVEKLSDTEYLIVGLGLKLCTEKTS